MTRKHAGHSVVLPLPCASKELELQLTRLGSRSEWLMAVSRLLLAATIFLVSISDDEKIGFVAEKNWLCGRTG